MNIIVADNQDITRMGLLYILDRQFKDNAVKKVSDREQLLAAVRGEDHAVVILDYNGFDFSGASQLRLAADGNKGVRWLLFCEILNPDFLNYIRNTGSNIGVVFKSEPADVIINAIRQTLLGNYYVSPRASELVVGVGHDKASMPNVKLTRAEQTVLREIALGKTTKEIAHQCNLSFHTVNTHRKNIFRKLEVNNVHEAIKYAIRAGIADMSDYYI